MNISELLLTLRNLRSAIRNAIRARGVDFPATERFLDFPKRIMQIPVQTGMTLFEDVFYKCAFADHMAYAQSAVPPGVTLNDDVFIVCAPATHSIFASETVGKGLSVNEIMNGGLNP